MFKLKVSSRNVKAESREEELSHVLPHGSGIDYDWDFEVLDRHTVKASNGWHYMSPSGYYLGGIGFEMILRDDGTFEGPEFDVDQLAKDQLGRDIVEVLVGDDEMNEEPRDIADLSEAEIKSILKDEMGYIADNIWQTFDMIDKDKLAKAVDLYAGDLYESSRKSAANRPSAVKSYRRPLANRTPRRPMGRFTSRAAFRRTRARHSSYRR